MLETFLLIHLSTAGVMSFVGSDFCRQPKPGRVWEIGSRPSIMTNAIACGHNTPAGVWITNPCPSSEPIRYAAELKCACGRLIPKDSPSSASANPRLWFALGCEKETYQLRIDAPGQRLGIGR